MNPFEDVRFRSLRETSPVILEGIAATLAELGIPTVGHIDLADTPEGQRLRQSWTEPGRLLGDNPEDRINGPQPGLVVSGPHPDDPSILPHPETVIPSPADMTRYSTFTPTGTVQDCLLAQDAIFEFLVNRHDAVANFLATIGGGFDPPMPEDVMVQMWAGWLQSVADPDAALIYVAPDLVDAIWEASLDVPEFGEVPDLALPLNGLIVLGKPVTCGTDDNDPMKAWMPGFVGAQHTAFSWNTYPPIQAEGRGSWMLSVTPWTRVAAGAAGFLHGDVVHPDDRAAGAELISGPLAPAVPTWIDGFAPRLKAASQSPDGNPWGWGDRPNAWIRFVAALALWMKQEIVRADDVPLPRAESKRRARAAAKKRGGTGRPKVLKLRRLEGTGRTADEFGGSRSYSKQWFVRGHWRTYWTGPGRAVPEPRYIARYIAGPEDMPLDPKSDAIWKVDR